MTKIVYYIEIAHVDDEDFQTPRFGPFNEPPVFTSEGEILVGGKPSVPEIWFGSYPEGSYPEGGLYLVLSGQDVGDYDLSKLRIVAEVVNS